MSQAIIIAFVENIAASPRLRRYAETAVSQGALLVCADSGGEAALGWGLTPDWVVGDMDSIRPAARTALESIPTVTWRIVPPEKDETDLELALYTALEQGARNLTILGGLGGRLDHTLGNLYLLATPHFGEVGAKLRLLGEREEIFLLRGGEELQLTGQPGELVSLIPLSSEAKAVRTEGLYYPLRAESLFLGPSRGISNHLVGPTAKVTFEDGLLLVIHSFA